MRQTTASAPAPAEEAAHAQAFIEHAMTPRNLGILPLPAVRGQGRGSCGDVIELYMRVEEGRVTAARFMPQGCVHTIACGSALTSLVQGLPLDQAACLSPAQVEETLGGLPKAHQHCAVVAVAALKSALRGYHEDRSSPWKRMYQR